METTMNRRTERLMTKRPMKPRGLRLVACQTCRLGLSAVAALSTAALASAQVPTFALTDIGVVNGSSTATALTAPAAGVNSSGQVVGINTLAYSYVSGGSTVNTTYQNAYDTGAGGANFNALGAGTGTAAATSGVPPSSTAYGINNSGIVAGRTYVTGMYNDPTYGTMSYTNANHAYRLNSVTQTAITTANDLGTLGQTIYRNSGGVNNSPNTSEAFGINASGQIVGASTANVDGGVATSNPFHVFRINANEPTLTSADDLGTLTPGASSYGYAISSLGQVAGYGTTTIASQTHAFRLGLTETSLSAADDLGTIGSITVAGVTTANSFGYGINTAGQVVGTSTTNSGQNHAFRSSVNGASLSLLDLGTIAGVLSSGSTGFGIDTAGDVVGYDALNSGINHAFFYSNNTATMYDLNTLLASNLSGVVLNVAYGITDNGDIVAYGTENNTVHAFLLTPSSAAAAPEPTALILLLSGLAIGIPGVNYSKRNPRRSRGAGLFIS